MPNYENLRRYNEFNHTASKHGGVDKYLAEIKECSRRIGLEEGISLGRAQQKSIDIKKGLAFGGLSLVIGVAVGAAVDWLCNKATDNERQAEAEKLAALHEQSDEAEVELMRLLSKMEGLEKADDEGGEE